MISFRKNSGELPSRLKKNERTPLRAFILLYSRKQLLLAIQHSVRISIQVDQWILDNQSHYLTVEPALQWLHIVA